MNLNSIITTAINTLLPLNGITNSGLLTGIDLATKLFGNTEEEREDLTVLNKGVNDTPLCLIKDKNIFKKYTNYIFNYDESRKYKPLTYQERYYNTSSKEYYSHRNTDEYHLRIGDSCFIIPPEYIKVSEVSNTERVPGMRTISTIKKKYGYSTTDIHIEMYFNGYEQINGFKVESPFDDIPYYIDGLRPLLAQCKISPIMPVDNEMLNKECGVYCIAIQAITVNTVPGFPKILKVIIQATECNHSIYTDVPNFMFSDIIEWDLYKYNYQRLLTNLDSKNVHETVKLKPVDNLTSDYNFSISIFSDKTVNDYKEDEKEFMNMANAEYVTYLDSNENDLIVQGMQFGFNNIIVSPQLSNHEKPAVQYLGGGDTSIVIQITTNSKETVFLFKNLIRQSNYIVKKLKQVSGVGFVKIDNELLNMMGTQFMLIDRVDVETIPNFPNTYSITVECISYDVVNLMQEELEGFRPFEDNRPGVMEDCISQNVQGVYNKIQQDVYAEYKMCENSNLYPDLFLPTYEEVNKAITKINSYRIKKGITNLPYDRFAYSIYQDFIYGSPYASSTVVDPDFYFSYGYSDAEKDDYSVDDFTVVVEPNPAVVNTSYTSYTSSGSSNNENNSSTDSSSTSVGSYSGSTQDAIKSSKTIQEAYCKILLAQDGQEYVWGGTGAVTSSGKRGWDCSGFCSWGIWELGWNIQRQVNSSFIPNGICKSISKSELQPGDLLISSGHVACYIGNNETIEAMGKAYGVCKSSSEKSKYTQFGRIQWPQSVIDSFNSQKVASNDVSDYTLDGNVVGGGKQNNTANTTDYSDYTLDGKVVGNNSNKVSTTQKTISLGKWGDYHDKHDTIISEMCKQYNLSPNWMKALIRQECDMNEKAGPNSYNAVGLMQITKDPCSELGMEYNISKLKTPEYNLTVGFKYMNWMRDKFGFTDYNDLISAHNCGPYGWRDKWKPNDNYKNSYEMKTHKEKVNKYYQELLSNGGRSGEYKDGAPSADSSATSSNSSTETSSSNTVSTELVSKSHGSRTIDYHGILGIPYTDYSPINWLINNDEIIKNGIYASSNGNITTQDTSQNTTTVDTSGNIYIIKKPIAYNYNKRTSSIKYIVVHDTQNPGGTAMDHFSYFNGGNRGASADYFVDTKNIVELVDPSVNYSWHVGDGKGEYGITNQNSIGVELCIEKDSSYTKQTWDSAIRLVRYLMNKYNVDIDSVVRHYDASRKTCPKSMMDKNWLKWNTFKSELNIQNSLGNNVNPYFIRSYQTVHSNNDMFNTLTKKTVETVCKKIWQGINKEHSLEFTKSIRECLGDMNYIKSIDTFLDPENNEYLSTAFVNDIQYNKRGSMLRAFPTFMVMINDDNEAWFDGKKLWSNYYPYKSVISLSVFHEREQPVGTLKMSITNMSGNLTRTPTNSIYKSISNDSDYSLMNRWLYKHFGFILGSPKVTDTMIESRNIINKEIKLKPGARLHVRVGYGSNPFSLNTVFNGTIAEMTTGEVIDIIAQSDGAELVNNIVAMGKEDETNGTMNLSKEASNIITSLLIDRDSAFKTFVSNGRWGESSKYNIEHFGTYTGIVTGVNRELEYDLCKNVYLGRFNKALYCAQNQWNVFDEETDIEMFIYNKTPWDVTQTVVNTLPEFVCQPMYHQFDSRIFFGLPTWLCKYRYDINESGAVIEQAKTFQQMHMINSSDIIDNRVKCTNKFSATNVVAMYTVAGEMKASPTLFSDKDIDWSKQKTKVIDTIVQQDYLLWEPIWEALGLERAKENGIAIGLSNLIYSWGTQYFDDIICLGKPGIKPIDQLYIDDEYSEMYGICTARSVTHTIGPETGFITTVSPHMEAICSLQDSGSTNIYRSKMAMLNTISTLSMAKNNTIRDLELLTSMVYDIKKSTDTSVYSEFIYTYLKNMSTQVIDLDKKKENLENLLNDVKKEMTFSQKTLTAIDSFNNNIMISTTPSMFKMFSNYIFRDIIDYFKYQNCIIARPLFHKGYPFISGTKGQRNLIEGTSNNPFYADEDGIYTGEDTESEIIETSGGGGTSW